ncbi:MAG: glycosyltransferase family 4 protein [Ardenticatenaceae bacterium]
MRPTLRIALIVPYGVDRRAQERVIPALLWLIERLGGEHLVDVLALGQSSKPFRYQLLGATVYNLGEVSGEVEEGEIYGLKRWLLWREVMRVARKNGGWDLIHGFWAGTSGWLAVMEAHRQGVPSVVSVAGGELAALPDINYGGQLNWEHRWEVAETLRLATRLTVSSNYMRRFVEGHGYHPDIVPLGVDKSCFAPAEVTVPGKKNSQNNPASFQNRVWRLLHVAALKPVKDQNTLLKGFRRVVDQFPHVHLDIIGQDRLKGAIQAQCSALQLDQHVTFHGFLPNEEVRPFFQHADLFLLPSRHEAAPVVVLEAAACRVPTVGTNVGYVGDWAGERALAVPVGDADAFAGAILSQLRNPQQRLALGRAAYQWARTHDADWSAQRFEAIYKSLLKYE